MGKILSYQERLAILDHQPALAADDLKITWKINSGEQQEPNLICGLVYNGVVAIQLAVVTEGLAKHVWDDRELAEMDDALGKIDFLAETQFCVRGEMAVESIQDFKYVKAHRLSLRDAMTGSASTPSTLEDTFSYVMFSCLVEALPNGWFDEFEAAMIRFNLLGVVKMVDPISHRAFPEKEKAARASIATSRVANSPFLSNTLYFALPSVKKFAFAQSEVDEARIACRLERYRLVDGHYPATLADLRTISGGDLPNDVMTAKPYLYKLQPDGNYLLYSVGWNQADDGGDRHLFRYTGNYEADDWVWPNVPSPLPPQ